jgi:anaerobic selenocysteine-containing dehydrogenase
VVLVEPGEPDARHRFQIAPPDIVAELAEVLQETASVEAGAELPFRLIVRRIRSTHNSLRSSFPEARKRGKQNPLYVHPEDLSMLGLAEGDRVMVAGHARQIPAIVSPDDSMRRGVVSMTHCWGMLPGDDYEETGVSTSLLVRTDVHVEPINAMPAMTAIPVRITASSVALAS